MREWEDVGGVDKWQRAFTWGIEGPEQEDEETDETNMSGVRARDVVSSQEVPAHLGESEQEQGSSSIGIDGPDGRPGESSITHQLRRNPGGFPDT